MHALKLDQFADANYVEGIAALNGGLLIEHGWVIRRDGTVIDPTLPRRCVAYFPGLEFVGRAGIDQFLAAPQGAKCRRSPFFYAFGWGGSYSPSYSAAWNQAMAFQERFLANKEVSKCR